MRYRFHEFELDTERELLLGPDGPAELRPQAWRMLRHLVERAPALVTRDELMDALWGHHALSPNVLPQTISELRQALGDDAQQPRFVETRHRRGYAFIAPVQRVDADPPAAAAAQKPDAAATAVIATAPARRWSGLVVLLLLLALAWAWRQAQPPPAPAPALAIASHRLAVELRCEDARLAGYLRALAQASDRWVAPTWAPAGAWSLRVARDGAWTLHAPDGGESAGGALPASDVHSRALALVRALELASGRALHASEATGWPSASAGREALADGLQALAGDRLAEALVRLQAADAGAEPGWARWHLAHAQARAGDWRTALAGLAGLRNSPDRALALRAEALSAQLDGRATEALAAQRARVLLQPEDSDAAVELADAQLAQAQWSAAGDTLGALQATLAASPPALRWRQALWTAATQPASADAAFAEALQAARAAQDAEAVRRAQMVRAEWLARRGRLADAWASISELESDSDPHVARLLGQIARERGELDRAQADLERARDAFQARGEAGEARRARFELGLVAFRRGDATTAANTARALLAEADASADRRVESDAHELLGLTLGALGDTEPALGHLRRAVELARSHGSPRQLALAQLGLGNLLAQLRRNEEAEAAFAAAAEGFSAQQDDGGAATALANLGALASRAGRHAQAHEAYGDALARMRELGIPREVGRIAFNLGVVERERGQLAAAAAHFDEALRALADAGAGDLALQAGASLAELELLRGDPAAARRALAAVGAERDSGAPAPRAAWLAAEGRLLALAGEYGPAAARYREARALREQAGARAWVLALDLRLATLGLVDAGAARSARVTLERLEAEFRQLGEPTDALGAALAVAESLRVAGDVEGALARLDALQSEVRARGSRAQQHQFDWQRALASEGALRDERLRAVAAAAAADGFELLARLARHAALAESAERTALAREIASAGLGGALGVPAVLW